MAITDLQNLKAFDALLQNGVSADSLSQINAMIDSVGLPFSHSFFSLTNSLLTNDTIMIVSSYVTGELSQVLTDFIEMTYTNLGTVIRNPLHNALNPVINNQYTQRFGHEDYDNATNF